jgi:hypothetical protein
MPQGRTRRTQNTRALTKAQTCTSTVQNGRRQLQPRLPLFALPKSVRVARPVREHQSEPASRIQNVRTGRTPKFGRGAVTQPGR